MNCKYCSGDNVIKHGNRQTRNGPVQIYLCRSCDRVFSMNIIPYMNTRSLLILKGISLYNQGYSLGRSVKIMENVFNEKVPRNTLHYWTKNYNDIFTYLNIRKKREPMHPLLPRVYGGHTFSLHKNKASLLPDELEPISHYLAVASKGIEEDLLKGKPLMDLSCVRCRSLIPKMKFERSKTESKIIDIAIRNGESDPLRYILINDSKTLARSLPLYMLDEELGALHGTIDLLQIVNNRIRLLTYIGGPLTEIKDLKHLIGCGHALVQRTKLPITTFIIGAFNAEEMWTLDLPVHLRSVRVKNN